MSTGLSSGGGGGGGDPDLRSCGTNTVVESVVSLPASSDAIRVIV
jgi:hypothetical protein